MNPIKTIKSNQFWLLGIASGLIAIHVTLTSRQESNIFVWSIIFWIATSFLVWRKRDTLNLDSSFYATILGLLLVAIILFRSSNYLSLTFIGIAPFVSALALSLIASGFKGIKQYKQELILLFFFNIPHIVILPLIDISALTAKFATYMLWYLGFEASVEGVSVVLPQGSVVVYHGCSGLSNILNLIRLTVMFLILFPLKGSKQKILVFSASVVIAFLTNSMRIAVMAILTAAHNQVGFDYWHKGKGSLIFPIISTAILGIIYYFLLTRENNAATTVTKIQTQETLDG
ncbi:cyanoexosortase A [Nostoc sp. UHCC 0870]|uniref:cyanoexosortase A n=1 Tax=Nostoc sp. UHCC 0870 TaxID=2914041 RepID=UPI001EDD9181|nr:cyanoexosortase A [Nostoc sp. UHCC 0870]UKO98934.1 cyanoexosortase A [Nostoc sp. UHCC 0870]